MPERSGGDSVTLIEQQKGEEGERIRARVDALRALAESATPGPWAIDPVFVRDVGAIDPISSEGEWVQRIGQTSDPEDAAYIAAISPDVLLRLLNLIVPPVRVTHGRHCTCGACAREDWTRPELGPCGMHGEGCPAVYAPLTAATRDSGALPNPDPAELRERDRQSGKDLSPQPGKTRGNGIGGVGGSASVLVVEADRYDEGWDAGRDALLNSAACSVCGDDHDRMDDAACPGCEAITLGEWIDKVGVERSDAAWEAEDARRASATKPEASPSPEIESAEIGDEQGSSSAEAGGMEWKLEPQLRKEGDWVSEPWRSAVLLTCRRCGGRTFEPFCPTCGAIIVPMWIPEGYTEPIPFVRASTTTAEPSPSPESPYGHDPFARGDLKPSRPVSTDEEEGQHG